MMTRPSSSLLRLPAKKPLVVDGRGQIVPLGDQMGVGGEGRVYAVQNDQRVAAKIYHKTPLAGDHLEKLKIMVSLAADSLASIAAWPKDLLYNAQTKKPCGLLMPRIMGASELHELYGTATRARSFPEAQWHHMVLAARNTAAAFDAMHAVGVVVGDVNQGNLFVDHEMCVRFIDCDSFQIANSERFFPCMVGTPHFTPPELQSRRLSEVRRTASHDAFGMALLIFHLLFVGRHPFAGRYRGQGDMPIERAIAERRFAFSRKRDETHFEPPPASLRLTDLPPQLQQYFEQAFRGDPDAGQPRPTPGQWAKALEALIRQRATCDIDPSHVYYNQCVECPWCRIEAAGGPSFFVRTSLVAGSSQQRLEAYERCLAQLAEVRFPDLPPKLLAAPAMPPLKALKTMPRMGLADWLGWGWAASVVACAGGAACAGAFASWPVLAAGSAGSVLSTLALLVGSAGRSRRDKTAEYERRLIELNEQIHRRARQIEAAHLKRKAEFDTYAAVVNVGRERYDADAENIGAVIRQLREEQRDDHLRSLMIRSYRRKITGLQPSTVALLESYGIETALDVNKHMLAAIPNLDGELVIELLNWRERHEEAFAFQPEAGITEKEIEADRQEATNRFKISQARKVLNGATRLRALAHSAKQALDRDLANFKPLTEQFRSLAREFQDFRVTRRPIERLINQSPAALTILGLAPPLIGWLLYAIVSR